MRCVNFQLMPHLLKFRTTFSIYDINVMQPANPLQQKKAPGACNTEGRI
jgi:hypothetical protein